MRKFISSLVVVGVLALSTIQSQAVSISMTIAANSISNLFSLQNGSAKITQIILTAPAANIASVQFIDGYTNWLGFTNAAYTNLQSYATNYITTWTNFYGVANSTTNLTLVDATNTVAATVVLFPVRMQLSALTNSVTRVDNVNYYFNDGVFVTNTGPSTATVTVTYQQ